MIEPLYRQNELDADQADRDRSIEARRRYRPRPTGTREDKPMLDTGKQHGPHEWERYQWRLEDGVWRADVEYLTCEIVPAFGYQPDGFNARVLEGERERMVWRHYYPRYDPVTAWELSWSLDWDLWRIRWAVIEDAEFLRRWDERQNRVSTV